MLQKEDKMRPSMSEVLTVGIVQKHMTVMIQTNCALPKRAAGPFEIVASATAQRRESLPEKLRPSVEALEKRAKESARVLTAKESLRQRKEEASRKKFEEIKQATVAAHIQIAMYHVFQCATYRNKQRKKEEIYSDKLSSTYEKSRLSSPLPLRPGPEAKGTPHADTQTTFELNDRAETRKSPLVRQPERMGV